MEELIVKYLPWLLSAITVYSMLLAGNKRCGAWVVGLINQALWLVYIFAAGAWGLLPMNVALWIVYARNYWKWSEPRSQSIGSWMEIADLLLAHVLILIGRGAIALGNMAIKIGTWAHYHAAYLVERNL